MLRFSMSLQFLLLFALLFELPIDCQGFNGAAAVNGATAETAKLQKQQSTTTAPTRTTTQSPLAICTKNQLLIDAQRNATIAALKNITVNQARLIDQLQNKYAACLSVSNDSAYQALQFELYKNHTNQLLAEQVDRIDQLEASVQCLTAELEESLEISAGLEYDARENDALLQKATGTIATLQDQLTSQRANAECLTDEIETCLETSADLQYEFEEQAFALKSASQDILSLKANLSSQLYRIDCLVEDLEICLERAEDTEYEAGETEVLLQQTSKELQAVQEILASQNVTIDCLKDEVEQCLETSAAYEFEAKEYHDQLVEARGELATFLDYNVTIDCLREELEETLEIMADLTYEEANLKEELDSLKLAQTDGLVQIGVLEATVSNLTTAMTSVTARVEICEGACLRQSGQDMVWNSTTDGVVMQSVACAGEQTTLTCPSGGMEIVQYTFGHGNGLWCSLEQMSISDVGGCVTNQTVLADYMNTQCHPGNSSCTIEAKSDGFGAPSCGTPNLNNLEVYFKCS